MKLFYVVSVSEMTECGTAERFITVEIDHNKLPEDIKIVWGPFRTREKAEERIIEQHRINTFEDVIDFEVLVK